MAALPLMLVVFTLPTTLVMLGASDAFVMAVISGRTPTWPLPVCKLSARLSMPLSASLHVIATWNSGDGDLTARSIATVTCGAVSSTVTGAVVVFLQTAAEVLVGTVHAITSPQYLVNTNGRRITAAFGSNEPNRWHQKAWPAGRALR